jgi:hypothetical protein
MTSQIARNLLGRPGLTESIDDLRNQLGVTCQLATANPPAVRLVVRDRRKIAAEDRLLIMKMITLELAVDA